MTRAVTSASNLFRRALCPGSERMESGLPDEDSDDSREGTLLHNHDDDAHPELFGGLTLEQLDLLKMSRRLDQIVFQAVQFQFKLGESTPKFFDHREIRLNYLGLPGHADRLRYYPDPQLAIVIDKKFGRKEQVPAALNKQLRAYAVMTAEWVTVKDCVVAITQPRLSFDERITMAAYTAEDIAAARDEIDEILGAAADPDAPLVAGEEQCRYCKAKIKCPAYAEMMAPLTQDLKIVTKTSLDLATPVQISKLLIAIQFADHIKEQVRGIARKMIDAGLIEDWTLGKSSSYRKITDSAKAIALLQLKGDLDRDEILACSNPSLGKLKDKLRDKLALGAKEANDLINETLASVIEVEEKRAPLILKEK